MDLRFISALDGTSHFGEQSPGPLEMEYRLESPSLQAAGEAESWPLYSEFPTLPQTICFTPPLPNGTLEACLGLLRVGGLTKKPGWPQLPL